MTDAVAALALHPDHLVDLRKSGLSDATIAGMGVYSLSPTDQERILGSQLAAKVTSVLALPYPGTSFSRYRLYPPLVGVNGHGQKYFQPAGSAPELYVPLAAQPALADATVPLAITEGEKKAAKVTETGLACLGIGGLWCWRHQGRLLPALAGIDWVRRSVWLIPDSDVWNRDDLLQPVYAFGMELTSRGAVVEVVRVPTVTKGPDDFLATRPDGRLAQLPRLTLKEAPLSRVATWFKEWIKQQGATDEADQDALALLKSGKTTTTIHPAQALVGETFVYGIPTAGDLVFVTSERRLYTASDLPDGVVLHPETLEHSTVSREVALQWAGGATGSVAKALDGLVTFFTTYLVLRQSKSAMLLAGWALGTWCFRAFTVFPYLAIRSPEKRCGKTRLLKLLRAVTFNAGPIAAVPTEAQLFREAVLTGGTQLYDEMESLKKDRDRYEASIAVLNVGFEAGGVVTRMEKRGDQFVPMRYEVFAPRALAGISAIAETLEDRSLPLFMERRRRNEPVSRLPGETALKTAAGPLRDACALAVLEKMAPIQEAARTAPGLLEAAQVDDRATDLWLPLLALGIAADAEDGGTRSETLLTLAKTVGELRDADQGEGLTARLTIALAAIRQSRHATDTAKLTPDDLLRALQGQPGFEWLKSTRRLAGLLNPLGLFRKQVREGSRRIWQYHLEKAVLDDLVARYTPSDPDAGEGSA